MTFRHNNLSHIYKYSPIIRVVGKGLLHSTNNSHLHEKLKHLQIANGVARKHDDEELEGPTIFPNNGRHHLEHKLPPKAFKRKTITPLKYKF